MTSSQIPNAVDQIHLREWLNEQSRQLGFDGLRITDTHLGSATERLREWLDQGRHGQMEYMAKHADLRSDPGMLVPGTVRVICVTMNYLSPEIDFDHEWQRLAEPTQAVVSMYARGRDYHKVMRNRLQEFAQIIEKKIGSFGYRVFTDSAPLMEVELARKAGLGWRGKHTLLLNRESGSTFFLGEILVDVPLPVDQEEDSHCGTCQSCIDICPTQAITAPYQLDARRCISYLTIENPDAIPVEFRRAMGNRVYGCDDCQLICPWNKFAKRTALPDFAERHGLGKASLLQLWSWTEEEFEKRHEGSAIRRIGYSRWRRNLAVAMGNALADGEVSEIDQRSLREALLAGLPSSDDLVAEHIQWALDA
ncbi:MULTISPECIES: tRNA epoxyqueuosine(34) reductase QueG [unclassified Polynucleobacter]|uniref:tRNA epoxyqueuosine(34) reductase QueG n=1 Tax=unclassified Polynucleobacter TaxID=2640945 RepID=UPI0008D6F621|nr:MULTISPECIES: tRNA epoxyqueuosine(34) reductase QueG [unclassified Polynucleobacter]OHC09807.1 MAG: tRNA epoxyqueuosine(34) reductase QueG [Polynucleobacter sp. GWA2_45_21]HBK43373.1 tRNA epoxyqueuosine(34) reductase QueG [Polynucleobacter sp.]